MRIFGIGHAMVDIFCLPKARNFILTPPLKQNEIEHIASPEMDALLASLEAAVPEFSALSQKNRVSGGTAANILKSASVLGADCTFYGATGTIHGGRDGNALFFQKELGSYGVKSFLTSEDEPTGRFLIVKTSDGRFAGAAAVGAARKLSAAHAPENALEKADFAVIEGMVCMNEVVFTRLLDLCRRYKVIPVVDVASPFAAEKAVPQAVRLMADLNLPFMLFANEIEAAAIARSTGESFENFAKKLCAKNSQTVIIKKLGGRGAQAWFLDETANAPTQAKRAVDATGAGDVFAGAFLFSYDRAALQQLPEVKIVQISLEFANRAAALVLGFQGCRFAAAQLHSLT